MRELHLGEGSLEAVLLPEAGARLHRLRAFGHDLLRTPPDAEAHLREPFFWGAYVMAPWCNRLPAGDRSVKGRPVRLASNFPDGSAIHGEVYARAWSEDGSDGRLAVRSGGDGWPWPYEVTAWAEAGDASLLLLLQLTNLGDQPMPAGLGFHPWWQRPVQLRVAADLVYASNVSPTTDPEPVRDRFDLRTLARPAEGLDGTWAAASPPEIELAWPELGLRAIVTTSTATYVAVATPADLDAIAVEPQTHAPDGLRRLLDGRQDGLAVLPAGASLTLDVGISVRRD